MYAYLQTSACKEICKHMDSYEYQFAQSFGRYGSLETPENRDHGQGPMIPRTIHKSAGSLHRQHWQEKQQPAGDFLDMR